MSIRWTFVFLCGLASLVSGAAMVGFERWSTRAGGPLHHVGWLVAALAVLCAIALSVAYAVAQPVFRRLYDIEEAAALIASGRLHHRVETMGETDEIGQLGDQFNRMGETIEQQVALLQRLADENRRLAEAAERLAAVDERQRLARELHDSVSQQLFAVTMLAAAAQRQCETPAPALPATLRQLADLANAAQREMRALLLHLRPVDLDGRGFVDAARAFLSAVQDRHQLRCTLHADARLVLSSGTEEQLFRILQEAIANVLKHADAQTVEVHLQQDGYTVRLTVLDDGVGVDAAAGSGGESMGLRAMRERAQSLGGRCEIWRRDQGTAVEVQIPVVASDAVEQEGETT